ncbi:MAG: hypothetical protein CMP07_12000 [Xanthomonadales bacterium]|nr:hypothetical protein [Xanthomonadales bacterium]
MRSRRRVIGILLRNGLTLIRGNDQSNRSRRLEMLKLKMLCALIGAVAVAQIAVADDSLTEKEALAMEIIELTGADDMVDAMTGQIKAQMQQQMEKQISCPAEREVAAEMTDAFASTMSEMMRSSDLRADLILAYAELFTRDELEALVEFHSSDLGRKLIEVQPEIMRRSMQAAQRMSADMQAKMLEASANFQSRMKEIEGSCE